MHQINVKVGGKNFSVEWDGQDYPDEQQLQKIVQRIRDENPDKKLKPASEVTALVVDNGHFFELARTLARTYKKVYLYNNNISEAPKMDKFFMGYGYEEIECVGSIYGEHYDKADAVIFPDVGQGSEQVKIAKEKPVWGCRMAEALELDREWTKKFLKKIGMPVGPFEVVMGIEELRKFLKEHKDYYVKISRWRGSFESFLSSDYLSIDTDIDSITHRLGMMKYIQRFVCEKALPDKVELGMDCYTVNGEWPSKCLGGIEKKDAGYGGSVRKWKDFPRPVTELNEKFSPYLKEMGMCGNISTEGRIGEDHKFFNIDNTLRRPSPPGELMQEIYKNEAEIIWQGANGVLVDPEEAGKFGLQVNIKSGNGRDGEWQEIEYPKEFDRNVKLHNACIIKGRKYIIPTPWHLEEIGGIVAWGNSFKEAEKMLKEVAEQVKGPTLIIDTESVVADVEKELEKSAALGLAMVP